MLLNPGPVFDAIESVREPDSRVVYLSPQGRKFDQKLANELSREKHLILLCGHYEGIDNRIIDNYIDDEISIGDFVVTGGELPAMIIVDAVVRLLPGVLKTENSYEDDSHFNGLLEYPQYTRPRVFKDISVPEVLLSGNHKSIERWRKRESLKTTLLKRPDLLKDKVLDKEELDLLSEIKGDLKDIN